MTHVRDVRLLGAVSHERRSGLAPLRWRRCWVHGSTHGLPRPFALAGSLPKKMCVVVRCVCCTRVTFIAWESFFFPQRSRACRRLLGAMILRARGFDVRPPAGPERAAAAAAPDRASSGVSRERARTGEIFCPWGASLPLRVLPPRRETIAAGARVRAGRRGAGSRARACASSPMWGALPSARKAARLDCAPRSSAQRLPAARRASEGRSRATVGASYARARRRATADGSRGARRPPSHGEKDGVACTKASMQARA